MGARERERKRARVHVSAEKGPGPVGTPRRPRRHTKRHAERAGGWEGPGTRMRVACDCAVGSNLDPSWRPESSAAAAAADSPCFAWASAWRAAAARSCSG